MESQTCGCRDGNEYPDVGTCSVRKVFFREKSDPLVAGLLSALEFVGQLVMYLFSRSTPSLH